MKRAAQITKPQASLLAQATRNRLLKDVKRKRGVKGRNGVSLPERRLRKPPGNVHISNMGDEQMRVVAADYVKDFSLGNTAQRCSIGLGTMRKLSKLPAFLAIVKDLGKTIETEKIMDAQEVLVELSRLGRVNMEDYIEVNERGDMVVNLTQCSRAQLAAVHEYQVEEHYDEASADSAPILVRKPRIKLTGHKLEALKLLAQYNKVIGADAALGAPGSGMVPPALNVRFSNDKAQ